MTKYDVIHAAKKQLSLELGCKPEDFDSFENIILPVHSLEKRRHYGNFPPAFHMANFGKGSVITTDERLHSWLRHTFAGQAGYALFEEPKQHLLAGKLKEFGISLSYSGHFFLHHMKSIQINKAIPVKWYDQEEMISFYQDERFPNALMHKIDPLRPDVLAVASFEGNKITGMAGASADTKTMWQVGIDVLPEHRGQGLGTYLVSLLTNEIIRRGAIPFYSTSQANIFSQGIAVNCGYFPAWTELFSIRSGN